MEQQKRPTETMSQAELSKMKSIGQFFFFKKN